MSEIAILLVGQTERSEFRGVRAGLERLGRVVSLADAEAAAVAMSEEELTADVIVVAQSYPGEFSLEAVDRMRRLAPLSRLVGLMGSWCEGEMRSGKPWPGTVRLYWHQWMPQGDQQFRRILRGECSVWALPITASEEERLLLEADQPLPARRGLIAIYTLPSEMEDWLSAALRRSGYSTVWLRPPRPARVEGATAAIFDGSNCRPVERYELEHLAATLHPAPVIALLDFPRIEDHDRALAAGAAAVLSKPLHLSDLFWQLDRLLR